MNNFIGLKVENKRGIGCFENRGTQSKKKMSLVAQKPRIKNNISYFYLQCLTHLENVYNLFLQNCFN